MQVQNKQRFDCQNIIQDSIKYSVISRDEMCNGIIEHNDEMCNGIIEHNDEMCNGIIEHNDDYLNEYNKTFLDDEVLNDMGDHYYEGYDKEKTECEHKYILDLIDVDPDRAQVIEYCEKCLHVIV
jgi:hypothetical protein